MRRHRRTRQAGISFFGLLFVIVVLASVGVVGAQALPTYMEYESILKAVNKAQSGGSVQEIRQIFDKTAQIDNINSISARDLEIGKNGDKVVVSFSYSKEIHMFGPAYLLLKYKGQSN